MPQALTRPEDASIGFFGKLPSHGDFLCRRLPRSFVDPWDSWLQTVIANSREQLAEAWLEIYLTSPIWRFAVSTGLCGDKPWTGVLMPSVDRVGRYFPLTLAAPLDVGSSLMQLLTDADSWYLACEDLALSTLEDNFDIELFDQSLQALDLPATKQRSTQLRAHSFSRPAWQFGLSQVNDFSGNMPCISQTLLNQLFQAYSLWWTQGSERVSPSLLIAEGLPPVAAFSGMLDGDWNKWGWGQYRLPFVSASGTAEAHQPAT